MPCYNTKYFYQNDISLGKKHRLQATYSDECNILVRFPCNDCAGCLNIRAQEWGIRATMEARYNQWNQFITLTYDDEHLTPDHQLERIHIQNFIRKLRRKYPDRKISHITKGEYGTKNRRPHYHLCAFNLFLFDLELDKYNTRVVFEGKQLTNASASVDGQHSMYTSKTLTEMWGKGEVKIKPLTYENAAYTAGYTAKHDINKKQLSREKFQKYVHVELLDKKVIAIPEFFQASTRPYIGKKFYEEFKYDIYAIDAVVVNGYKHRPPKIFDKKFEKDEPDLWDEVRQKRIKQMQDPKRIAETVGQRNTIKKRLHYLSNKKNRK